LRKQSRYWDWVLLGVTFMLVVACGVAEGPVSYSGARPDAADHVRQLEVTPGGAGSVANDSNAGGADTD